jgi:hypothetical protein
MPEPTETPQNDIKGNEGGAEEDVKPGLFDGLPDDLKGSESLQGIESMEQLTKAYIDARGQVDGLPKPPENPDGYDLGEISTDGMAWDKTMASDFYKIAHEAGLTNEQFQKIMGWSIGQAKAANDSAAKEHQKAVDALRTEWGQDYDQNLETAKRTAAILFGDDLKDVTEALGNNPKAVKALFNASGRFSEDSFHKGGPARSAEKSIAETLYPHQGK